MRTSRLRIVTALAAALIAPQAAAQPAKPAPAAQPPPSAAQPAKPPTIDVNDPLLAPFPQAPHVLASWREALTLISARSSDLKIASQEVEKAEGLSRQALAGALPTLTADGTVAHNIVRSDVTSTVPVPDPANPGHVLFVPVTSTVPPTPTAIARLILTQPVLAPRAWYAIGTANRSVDAAKLRVEDQRRLIVATVANAIVAVVTAERVAEINRVGLRSALERLELMQRRLRLESGTKLDVVRAEQDANLARNSVVTSDESLRQAREALGLALGSAEPYGVPTTISLDGIARDAANVCRPAKPDDRADVRAARTDLEVAERGVTDVKLGYLPTAAVSSTMSYSKDPLVGDKHYAWSIQGVISLTIWDGGARYGEARTANAGVAQSRERIEVARRGATLESSQANRGIAVAEQARVLAEQGRDLAKETARLSQVAFEAGNATSFDLVESARRQREAELNLAVREFDLVKAKITALLASASCTY